MTTKLTIATALSFVLAVLLPGTAGVFVFVLYVVVSTPAAATMPALTDAPNPATSEACRAWAASQDDEAIYMWGVQTDGTYSNDVGIERLYQSCMGHKPPEIVGFGSSIGFDEAYCEKHRKEKICER